MSLPPVTGWVIDFRTAREIWISQSNARINHTIDQCKAGKFHICHCEEALFKSLPALRTTFIDDQDCVYAPDSAIADRCIALSNHPMEKRIFKGNQTALFITAIAAANNFGVISDHRSPTFATVYDLCEEIGVPVLSADEYFDEI